MPTRRTRKINTPPTAAAAAEGNETDGAVAVEASPEEKKASAEMKKYKFTPYEGDSDTLPKPTVNSKGRTIKAGEARYFLRPVLGGHDLVAIYNNGKGTAQRLVKTLKTVNSGKPGSEKRVRPDKALFDQLRKAGVPVLHE